jgi:glycosyltransferase involved in cell wall biosynthesis
LRVAFVVPSFYPAVAYGGPIWSTLGLTKGLARLGCDVRVLTTNANAAETLSVDPLREHEVAPGVLVRYTRRPAVGPSFLELVRLLPSFVRWADVIHLTAVYSFPTLPTLTAARVMKKPLVWATRGALQRWSGTRHTVAKAGWNLACRALHPPRMLLHVTAEQEAQDAMKRMPGVPTVLVPNGVDVPSAVERRKEDGVLRVLFLGRLDPIKGLENLFDAFSLIGDAFRWNLTIAGGGPADYTRTLEDRASRLGLSQRTSFVGSVDDDARRTLFSQSDVLVLSSHSENFGMVVLEALAHGVPVIASKGTPWEELVRVGCGLWVENAPTELAAALRSARTLPLEEMGAKGRQHVERNYSWDAVCSKMLRAMRELRDRE